MSTPVRGGYQRGCGILR